MSQLTCVLFSASDWLSTALGELDHLEIVERVDDGEPLHDALRRRHPDVLFVDLGDAPGAVLDEVERIPAPRPLLIVAGPQEDSRIILRAMRLGAREFLAAQPVGDALRLAMERLLLEHQPVAAVKAVAPVIAVMGAKGGVGATFAACQTAAELERLGNRTVLVDANLRLGDVSLFFDLQPRYNLANLAAQQDDFDSAYLQTVMESHRSGVRVLAAPPRAEDAEFVRVSHLERAISLLRREYDWVVLDVSRTWDEVSVRALDLADEIFLVTLMDVPTLNHARQHLDLLQRLGHPAEKIRLLVNRHVKSGALSAKDVADFLGRQPDACIPNDYPTTLACVNEGKSLSEIAPRSALSVAYQGLARDAHRWCEVEPPNSETGRSARAGWSFFEGLRRKQNGAD
jgi:pilus assembly protein CpaE